MFAREITPVRETMQIDQGAEPGAFYLIVAIKANNSPFFTGIILIWVIQ